MEKRPIIHTFVTVLTHLLCMMKAKHGKKGGTKMVKRIAVLLMAAFLLACQPTPEKDAVKGKDTNVLIDTVRNEQQEQSEPHATQTSVRTQLPERYQCDFYTDIQHVQVVSDVPLRVRSDGGFPMIRVGHRYLTNEELLTVYKRLFGKDELYVHQFHRTRADVEREIAVYIQDPTEEEIQSWKHAVGGTDEDVKAMLERRHKRLAELQAEYAALPDNDAMAPLAVWDGSLPEDRPYNEGYNIQYIVGSPYDQREPWQVDTGTLYGRNSDSGVLFQIGVDDFTHSFSIYSFTYTLKPGVTRIEPAAYDTPAADASITPNEAAAIALKPFEGMEDFAVTDIYWSNDAPTDGMTKGEVGHWAYLVEMAPRYGDAEQLYILGGADSHDDENQEFARGWTYESATVAVDGSGKLLAALWLGPQTVEETIAETTTLLPLDEIQSILAQQVNRLYSYDEARDGTLTITGAELGLFRIREKNDMEHGLLVPVWRFTSRFDNASGEPHGQVYTDDFPLVLINAIDGSIIDVFKGY